MKSISNIMLILASMSFTCIIGAGLYEHLTLVPVWSSAPPASLYMFQGKYGFDSAFFWQTIHPVTILLFIAALATNWKTGRRKPLLVSFAGYVLVLIITTVYFVPELLSIIGTPYSEHVDETLTQRASTWEMLSIVRMIFMGGLSAMMLSSLMGSDRKSLEQVIQRGKVVI